MKKIIISSVLSLLFIGINNIALANSKDNLSETANYSKDKLKFEKKEIFKSDEFDITSFAFLKDQGLKEHTTTFNSFLFIIEGEAIITIDNIQYILKAGDYIKLPANKPHSVKAKTNFKMLLTKPVQEKHKH